MADAKTRLVELVGVNRLLDMKTSRIYTQDDSPYEVPEEEAVALLKKRTPMDRAMFLEVFDEDGSETAQEAAGGDAAPKQGQRTSKVKEAPQSRRKGGVTISKKPEQEETVKV